MANTYAISSVTLLPNGSLVVIGTVNGVGVSLKIPDFPTSMLASAITFESYIAPLMLAAVPTSYPSLTLMFTI